ncbi:MAG TPA: DUF402 domain-containing protein [Pyrinomonadaceae bacterium]|jgi:protein associated with RNAse G/E|nr:DUF402 domain-containing protein [Pyrinomonadaceae bacterium]
MGGLYTVISLDYGGDVRRTWPCRFVKKAGSLLVLQGEFDREIIHPHLGCIKPGTVSIEYFWLDRWYNIFRFHEPDGAFRNFYCNVAMPPVLREASLEFVDLDIDLIVDLKGKVSVHDEDEYCENAARFRYAPDIETAVKTSVNELAAMINRRDFPFDQANLPQPSV